MKVSWKLVLNYIDKLGLNKTSVKVKNSALKLILSDVQNVFCCECLLVCERMCLNVFSFERRTLYE